MRHQNQKDPRYLCEGIPGYKYAPQKGENDETAIALHKCDSPVHILHDPSTRRLATRLPLRQSTLSAEAACQPCLPAPTDELCASIKCSVSSFPHYSTGGAFVNTFSAKKCIFTKTPDMPLNEMEKYAMISGRNGRRTAAPDPITRNRRSALCPFCPSQLKKCVPAAGRSRILFWWQGCVCGSPQLWHGHHLPRAGGRGL